MNCKKIILILLFVVGLFSISRSQSSPKINEYKFSHQIEKELEEGILRFPAQAAYRYSFIGNYPNALSTYDLLLEWGMDTISKEDSLFFSAFYPVDAFNYVLQKAQDSKVIIISEAHHKPQHRLFTRKLLQDLFDQGYRYFGLETLMPNWQDSTKWLMDTLLNERGYPLNSPLTGTYVQEPQMGNLIRSALAIGFELFAYEKAQEEGERDWVQAKKIKQFIDAHPDGKVLIHGGWYHAIESDFPKFDDGSRYMAHHLKNMGVDPLTIYQDALTEKAKMPQSPFFEAIESDEISVLLDPSGEVFRGKPKMDHFDVMVYHPKTNYTNGRPDWLLNFPGNQLVELDNEPYPGMTFPYLIKAYKKNEGFSTVPVDVIEVKRDDSKVPLVLSKGAYVIVVEDVKKSVIRFDLSIRSRK